MAFSDSHLLCNVPCRRRAFQQRFSSRYHRPFSAPPSASVQPPTTFPSAPYALCQLGGISLSGCTAGYGPGAATNGFDSRRSADLCRCGPGSPPWLPKFVTVVLHSRSSQHPPTRRYHAAASAPRYRQRGSIYRTTPSGSSALRHGKRRHLLKFGAMLPTASL